MIFVLDTDHITLYQQGHAALADRLAALPPGQLATSVITYEEQLEGRLAVVRRARTSAERVRAHYWLQRTLDFFCRMPILPFDEAAASEFDRLRKLGVRIGSQDLLIASIVLANHATLLTRNGNDFRRVPELSFTDWSAPT